MREKPNRTCTRCGPVAVMLLALFALANPGLTQTMDPELYGSLQYRHIGPPGNRLAAVAGIPGDPNIYYAGAASGGLWKTTDGGTHWEPIFDDKEVSSVSALAVAASDPNVVWAGTGETFIRSNISIGNGIYKSTDAGKTWQHMGLEKTGRIGRIVIDPGNPDVVLAAAMGHCYGPQQDRGVFRTTDGGKTWKKVLYVDEDHGASDIAMDPEQPSHSFCRNVEARDQDLGSMERKLTGRGWRDLSVRRRWRHLEAPRGKRTAHDDNRQDRPRHCAQQFRSRLCAHRNFRWGASRGSGDGKRCSVELG